MMFLQLLVVLASSLLCLSQQCHDDIYTNGIKYSSCREILSVFPETPSGYYVLENSAEEVYCDMENEHCGSQGWTRVAYVNMSSNTSTCPGNMTLIKTPIRSCGAIPYECSRATFSTHGVTYSQVCGRVVGYQVGKTAAFGPYVNDQEYPELVIDGVLISHGQRREHIWAYAAGLQSMPTKALNYYCPCTSYLYTGVVPAFIGNDYYCDSGVDGTPTAGTFYTKPLWTGVGCKPPNFCCSSDSMPWFCKSLPKPTSDDIDVYNCVNGPNEKEDVAVDLIEFYVR